MESLTGFVLAGGKSTRMGTDKAFLHLGGRPLIAHMLELAGTVCSHVRVVGTRTRFSSFAPVVEDVYADRGPLGGIHAALANSKTELNLMLGVDLPFLESRFLYYLVAEAQSSEAVVTVPVADGHVQTLCAIYRRKFLAFAQRELAEGRNKVDAVYPRVSVREVSEDALKAAGFNLAMFRNLNTPENWEQARLVFESRHPNRAARSELVKSDE